MIKEKPITIEEFEALPQEQQRVVIAQDVINRISTRQYHPHSGSYVTSFKTLDDSMPEDDTDIKSTIDNIRECDVCAIGALLMSSIIFKNSITYGDIRNNREGRAFCAHQKIRSIFASLFSAQQLSLIEIAFEGQSSNDGGYCNYGRMAMNGGVDVVDSATVRKTIAEYNIKNGYDEKANLLSIMQNIVDNNGTFKP